MARLIEKFFEVHCPSLDAARHEKYSDLGLTDCVTADVSNEILVITDDFRLSNILSHLGRDTININHIRMLNWT
jgi:hypothetical protein